MTTEGGCSVQEKKAHSTEGWLFRLPREAFQIVSPALPSRPRSKLGQSEGANSPLAMVLVKTQIWAPRDDAKDHEGDKLTLLCHGP